MQNRKLIGMIVIALPLAGCFSGEGPGYGDTRTAFPHAARAQQAGCNMNGNLVRQNSAECVGKTASAGVGGPTITVLKPGMAVPVGDVAADNLAPPPR